MKIISSFSPPNPRIGYELKLISKPNIGFNVSISTNYILKDVYISKVSNEVKTEEKASHKSK